MTLFLKKLLSHFILLIRCTMLVLFKPLSNSLPIVLFGAAMLRPRPGSTNVYIGLKKKGPVAVDWPAFQNLSTVFFSRSPYKSTSNLLLLRLDEQHFVLGCAIMQPAMEIEIWGNKAECQPNKGPSLAQREHWHTIESARGWKQGKGTGLPANRWAKREEWMWGDVSHKERNNTTWSWVLEMRG